jgi:hypothetical protein
MTMRKRNLVATIAAGAALLASPAARADGEREQCASAADQAQQLRDEGKYRRAREQMLVCARDVCPGPIKRDCLDWLRQLDDVAPTVVFAAKEGNKDLTDVKVTMDGQLITSSLDGRPIPVDLGKHIFKFEHGGQTQDAEVVIGAGQKGRNISVTFGAAPPPPPPPPPPGGGDNGGGGGGSLVPTIAVGAIGVVAIGVGTYFGLSGKSAVDDLQKCKPKCAESDVDSARTKLIVADISFVAGAVAIAGAIVLYLVRPKIEADVKSGKTSSIRLDIGPSSGGGAAALSGTF